MSDLLRKLSGVDCGEDCQRPECVEGAMANHEVADVATRQSAESDLLDDEQDRLVARLILGRIQSTEDDIFMALKSSRVQGAAAALTSAWQPIDTAPRDGTRVLIAWADTGVIESAEYHRGAGWTGAACFWTRDPTHWRPLPAPPPPKETP